MKHGIWRLGKAGRTGRLPLLEPVLPLCMSTRACIAVGIMYIMQQGPPLKDSQDGARDRTGGTRKDVKEIMHHYHFPKLNMNL